MLTAKQIAIKAALYESGWTQGTSAREIQDQDPEFTKLRKRAQSLLESMGRPGTVETLDIIQSL